MDLTKLTFTATALSYFKAQCVCISNLIFMANPPNLN